MDNLKEVVDQDKGWALFMSVQNKHLMRICSVLSTVLHTWIDNVLLSSSSLFHERNQLINTRLLDEMTKEMEVKSLR
jgi:hypothetical protein